MKSVEYEMKKKKKKKKKKATILKTTGWCSLLWHFLPGNNIRPESKEIIIIINNNNNNNGNINNKTDQVLGTFRKFHLR